MSLGRYKTAGDILAQAGRLLGLGTTANPFTSSNAVWSRLVACLTLAGQRLASEADWPNLISEAVLTKSGGVWTLPSGWAVASGDVLNLPPDFGHMIPQTNWDRTNRLMTGGPMSPQTWQYRQASIIGSIYAEFRMDTNQVRFLPTPLGNRTIAMEYASRAWVRAAAQGLGNGNTLGPATGGWDTPEATGDYILFDPLIIDAALKLEWKKATGQDTSQAQKDYDDIVSTHQSHTPRRVLSLDGSSYPAPTNVPDTGFGS